VTEQLREKLDLNAVLLQIPIGLEARFQGVVDLITMEALYFDGGHGEIVRREAIPDELRAEAEAKRETLLDALSLLSDELAEAVLAGDPPQPLIRETILRGVIAHQLCPVLIGSAYRNKAVQPLLDAIVAYLPNPLEATHSAIDLAREGASFPVEPSAEKPLIALAFKLEDGPFGQLTYLRMYQGALSRGDTIVNARTGRRTKVNRLVRMHADEMEEIEDTMAGDIVALFGIECASGDSFTDGTIEVAMAAMHVPVPVIKLTIKPIDPRSEGNLAKALQRFTREDPTFHAAVDEETGETTIAGMGELHLDIYVERMRREYNAEVVVGAPQVAYREAITQRATFDYTHRKQTGGSGQYGRIAGALEPADGEEFEFDNRVVGGNIPTEYIPSIEKGFRSMIAKGDLVGFPIVGVRVVLEDGRAHSVDSSDMAFQATARGAFRDTYRRAQPRVLEPVMKVAVECPNEYHGDVLATLLQRRGLIIGTTEDQNFVRVEAEVPLAEMFAYSTVLRSATQGKAEFTMEFSRYAPAPAAIAEEQIKNYQERRAAGR
jgi:elongation factor G